MILPPFLSGCKSAQFCGIALREARRCSVSSDGDNDFYYGDGDDHLEVDDDVGDDFNHLIKFLLIRCLRTFSWSSSRWRQEKQVAPLRRANQLTEMEESMMWLWNPSKITQIL